MSEPPVAESDDHAFVGELVSVTRLSRPAPPLQVPRSSEEAGVSARLAEINSQARRTSLDRLADWFPGYDFEAAAQTVDDRRLHVLKLGDVLGEHLQAGDAVDRLIAHHDLQAGRLMFSHGDEANKGKRPPRVTLGRPNVPLNAQAVERVASGPAVAALRARWTTIINNADNLDPALSQVCEHLERAYGCLVNTNVYISWGESLGFGQHWDQHDTIIVPARGIKQWRVFEPNVLSPLRPWIGGEVSDRPVWEGSIGPGDALVIPRGWGHEVLGSEDLAIHYTIGVNRFLSHQLFERLNQDAGHWPIMRSDVPYDPDEPVHSYERSLYDGDTDLADFLAELATPDTVDRAIATYRARMTLRMWGDLTSTWRAIGAGDWTGLGVRMPVPAGLMAQSTVANAVAVAFGDRSVTVQRSVLDDFLMLAGGDTVVPKNQQLATELVEAGVAYVAPI